jgi:2-polyprenyl-3-methyl-5-hydroxy-6-metoxy-1,4-benzoquinol methylase
MEAKSLREHCERKYASEGANTAIDLVPVRRVPTDRFQAAVRNFPRFLTGGEILELTAGSGAVAKTLLQSGLAIRSYHLGDISLPRIEGLKRNLEDPRVSVVNINAESVDATEAKFDAVLMIALIEHLIDPMRAMTSIRRLLRPGGICLYRYAQCRQVHAENQAAPRQVSLHRIKERGPYDL